LFALVVLFALFVLFALSSLFAFFMCSAFRAVFAFCAFCVQCAFCAFFAFCAFCVLCAFFLFAACAVLPCARRCTLPGAKNSCGFFCFSIFLFSSFLSFFLSSRERCACVCVKEKVRSWEDCSPSSRIS